MHPQRACTCMDLYAQANMRRGALADKGTRMYMHMHMHMHSHLHSHLHSLVLARAHIHTHYSKAEVLSVRQGAHVFAHAHQDEGERACMSAYTGTCMHVQYMCNASAYACRYACADARPYAYAYAYTSTLTYARSDIGRYRTGIHITCTARMRIRLCA